MSTVAERGVTLPLVPPRTAPRETLSLPRRLAADRLGLMTAARDGYGDAVRVSIGPRYSRTSGWPPQSGVIAAETARLRALAAW
jgi:hypothetical protein